MSARVNRDAGSIPVKARVWTGVGNADFVFPELRRNAGEGGNATLQAKMDFAVCLSGGGTRATTLGLGWVRVLQSSGILQRARYLTSNSGGSWFNVAFSYQRLYSREAFLGDYISPQELTPAVAKQEGQSHGSYAKAIVDSNFLKDALVDAVEDLYSLDWMWGKDNVKAQAWSQAVGKSFLEPFDLDGLDSSYCMHGQEKATRSAMPAATIHAACSDASMPFPIVVGCIAPKTDRRRFHCFEFTPLYSGCPSVVHDDSGRKIGGVLVEPHALNSKPPVGKMPPPGPPATMDLEVVAPVPLSQIAGVSSSYLLQMKANSRREGLWEAMGCPDLHIFDEDGQGCETPFADGIGVDNTAVHAALRRGVSRLLICYASCFSKTNRTMDPRYFSDVAALFGAVPEDTILDIGGCGRVDASVYNKHVQVRHFLLTSGMLKFGWPISNGLIIFCSWQVFESSKFEVLAAAVKTSLQQGKAVVVTMKLDVLANKAQGIQGGYTADAVWIFNSAPSGWQDSLPQPTREALARACDGNFPDVPTTTLDYEPLLVSCLSQLASWNMEQAIPQINALLASTPEMSPTSADPVLDAANGGEQPHRPEPQHPEETGQPEETGLALSAVWGYFAWLTSSLSEPASLEELGSFLPIATACQLVFIFIFMCVETSGSSGGTSGVAGVVASQSYSLRIFMAMVVVAGGVMIRGIDVIVVMHIGVFHRCDHTESTM